MKAAVVRAFGAPLEFENRPVPVPGPRQVVIKVEACGLCRADVSAARGEWPVRPRLPLVPGHEAVGRVVAVGDEVQNVRHGDRVAVPRLGWACGRCEYCRSGQEALCPARMHMGYDMDGGFAEYVCAFADFVVHVPFEIDALDAAVLSCGGLCAYKAVRTSGARPSDLTAVFGIGGVGHLAVQYARMAGASVVAVDTVKEKLEMAEDLGAGHVVNATVDDPVHVIQDLGGADQAIMTAVSPEAADDAMASLRPGGRLVLVAMPAGATLRVPIFLAVTRAITIVGSSGGSHRDLTEVFELHAAGRTRVVHEARRLEQVNLAIEELEADQVQARLVFELR